MVFADEQAKFSFLTRSTAKSEETTKWTDGKEYPLVKVQISSASHPFFTGEEKIIDTEGRVDRFKARAKKAAAMKAALANKAQKAKKEAEKKASASKPAAKKAPAKKATAAKKAPAKKAASPKK